MSDQYQQMFKYLFAFVAAMTISSAAFAQSPRHHSNNGITYAQPYYNGHGMVPGYTYYPNSGMYSINSLYGRRWVNQGNIPFYGYSNYNLYNYNEYNFYNWNPYFFGW